MDKMLIYYILLFAQKLSLDISSLINASSIELCGPESEIEMTKAGKTSSVIVSLPSIEHKNTYCKLRITAPKTHVINMQFTETCPEKFNNSGQPSSCIMSIFESESPQSAVWSGDLCSRSCLPDLKLLSPDFWVILQTPQNSSFSKKLRFVLTAIGQGTVCKEPSQHACMSVGWEPILCISDHLVCDGTRNCPKTSMNEEDETLCKDHFLAQTSWEKLAMEIFKKLNPPEVVNNKWLHEKLEQYATSSPNPKRSFLNWKEWQELKKIESTTRIVVEDKPKLTDSISQVLSKYGPWGYLMLGMLICGTVLMFCGLWECCFRKPKATVETSLAPTQPTTVLIINQPEELFNVNPPCYEDLDQPPSYTTLFPNVKDNSDPSDVTVQNNQA